ncbi:ribonuclease H1 domain-containing protein [Roseimaritima ulvae]|uniref:Ribonuclease H n=1 Tax=Roseimaritima ulvae TaxID=980254 RepID=A0A5B9QVJ6_9BACT|nr:ribonuclease H family protein [Roseimaritima ulvae]QEG43068.1 Ribonuclease H [Roseimaritima ulvae]
MAKKKPKFYVVWQGRTPGVYTSWDACQRQISGYSDAKYKSFPSRAAAETAFGQDANQHWGQGGTSRKKSPTPVRDRDELAGLGVDMTAWCVDAACKGNPGELEYQGVELSSGINLFHQGPYPEGTVNIGEFLAIVHALALLEHGNLPDTPIYSDSRIGISWTKQGKCKTKLPQTTNNQRLFRLIARAEKWLAEHNWKNPILKWETKHWGEIPADFGRK